MITIQFKDGDVYRLHPYDSLLLSWKKRFRNDTAVKITIEDNEDATYIIRMLSFASVDPRCLLPTHSNSKVTKPKQFKEFTHKCSVQNKIVRISFARCSDCHEVLDGGN